MISGTNNRTVFWILSVLALLLFAYTSVRSSTVCFTIDEAFTFQRYVKNSNWFPAEYDMHTANYHMLNTWLMIICSKIFGIAEWSLRLPNVLAHAVYLYFTAKFALRSKQSWSIVAVFVMLNVHPYLLDFFSVARGYGLSFGFLAASLWYVTEYFTNEKQLKHLALTLIFAGLATWANFALLTVFAAIALIIFIALLLDKETPVQKKLKAVGIGFGISFLFMGIAYPVLSQLQDANAFFWNASGLWKQTVCVLAAKLAYPLSGDIYSSPHVADFGMISCMLVAGIIVGYAFFRSRNSVQRTELLVLFAVLAVVMIEVVVQHLLVDAPYPVGRTALFLFVMVVWILAASLRDTVFPKRGAQIVCALIVALLVLHAGTSFNLSRTSEWNYCADVRNSLHDVVAKTEPDDDSFGGAVLGHDIEYGNIISYYLLRDEITNVTLLPCSESEDPIADYYIVSPYVKHKVDAQDTVVKYGSSELLLLQNKKSWLMQPVNVAESKHPAQGALNAVNSSIEVVRAVFNDSDSVYARVDMQVNLQFPRRYSQCWFQFWHERNNAVIWSGYYFVGAVNNGVSEVHTVNRNFPLKATAGDVIRVNIVPADSADLPIEISQIRTHLRVTQ